MYILNLYSYTPENIRKLYNMEPENGPLEDYVPLQPRGFLVPC